MGKNRLEAFSDGVFAIVITLLILEIHLPDVAYAQLGDALMELVPRILAYVMSFVVIGVYWVGHHQSFQLIKHVDGGMIWLNTLLLLCVSFLPFPTGLMGRYPLQPIPIIIYGLNLMATNGAALAMRVHLQRRPHLSSVSDLKEKTKGFWAIYAFVNGLYLLALGLCFHMPAVSVGIFGAVLVVVIIYYGWFYPQAEGRAGTEE